VENEVNVHQTHVFPFAKQAKWKIPPPVEQNPRKVSVNGNGGKRRSQKQLKVSICSISESLSLITDAYGHGN
jgi:hypothetical protein